MQYSKCRRTINQSRSKWHNLDKQLLFWVVCKYCQMHSKNIVASLFKQGQNCMDDNDWHEISKILGVGTKILKTKWLVMVKPQVKNSPWTQEEDQIIQNLIDPNEKNHNWTQIATSLAEMTHSSSFRNAKQIRERWNNYLNPTLKKSDWEDSEDIILIESVLVNGKRWSQISEIIGCRSESQVKNRYNSITNRLTKNYGDHYSEESLIQMEISSLKGQPFTFQHQILANNHKSNTSIITNNNDNSICNVKVESNSSESLNKFNTKQSTQSHSTSGGVLSDFHSPQDATNNSLPQITETLFLPDSNQDEIFASSYQMQSKQFQQSPSQHFLIPEPPLHSKHQSTQNGSQILSNQSDLLGLAVTASSSPPPTNLQGSNQQAQYQQAQFLQINQYFFNYDEHLTHSNVDNNQFTSNHSFNNSSQQLNYVYPPTNNNNANSSTNNNLFLEDWGFADHHHNNHNNNNNNNNTNIFYPFSTLDLNKTFQGLEQTELQRGSHIIQETQKQIYSSNNSFFPIPTTTHTFPPPAALSFFTEEPN